ncbi:hypothetical protein AB0L49_23680 [Streptomyces antimycoticus]|uniref:hypothetical protein n=1 Tax=Streptomyces antimycoticus TaxID=68175 RepID=UPI003429E828
MGERFATPDDVRRHWRLEEGDPYRISETKDEASNRRATVWRREERASEVELVGESLVIARMRYSDSGRYRWGVFHAGTAQPVQMLEYEDRKPEDDGARARALAEALDQWRDAATGEPFDWTSEGLIDRLRSPYGYGMLDQVRGRDPEARWAGSAPADAMSWQTDDGQEYTYDSSLDKVTVYDPDGLLIARGERRLDPKTRKSAFLGEMRDGRRIAGQRSSDFVQNAVWQHRIAQLEPAARDSLWIYYLDHRPIVHGTDRYADDWPDMKALLRSSGFTYSSFAKAYVTAGTTRAIARAQSVDRLARALYAQGRMVEIRADEDRLRGVLAPAAPAASRAAVLVPAAAAKDSPTAASAEASPAPAPETRPVLSPKDLTDEQVAAELERLDEERRGAAFGSPRHTRLVEQIAPLQQEHEQREVTRIQNRPDPAGMEDGEIASEREALAAALGSPGVVYVNRTPVATARRERDELLRVEQARRTAAELESRTPVSQMRDEDLQAEGAQLVKDRHRRPPEASDAFSDRVTAVGREIADRRLQAWGEQPPAEGLDDVELTDAIDALRGQRLSDTDFAGSYPAKERVEEAFEARRKVLETELRQRDEKAFKALLEADGRVRLVSSAHVSSTTKVKIDGRFYGELQDFWPGWRARLWSGRDITHDEPWRTDALRWLIEQYEKDPETRDTRTWGAYVAVELPPSFVDQLTTHFSDLTLSEEAEKYLITQVADSSRSQSWDETGKKIMVHALVVPERTLPVLERMGRRLVDRLDDELDSDDRKTRDRAKRARPNVLRALDDLVALMEARGLEPLGPDNASAEASQDGEADSERVRDDGPPALGDVPAAGAVTDGGPGGVLPGSGDGRAGTDRGADRGEDGRSDAGGGPPAAGGQAESGPADGPGAGAEGDRVPGAGGGQPGRGAAPLVFRPVSQDDLAPAGERAKAAANLDAVRVLKRVREEQRAATAAEQQVLARWSGWGSVPEIFAARPREDEPVFGPGGEREGGYAAAAARWESFADVRDPLRTLLDDDEWRAAAASTLSAHYTPPEITSALWQALADLGFDGGEVLEPGSGAGVTFGTAPESARLTGVEIDPTSAAISRLLAPGVTVLNESFADTVAADGAFDGVVGNVPFARVSLYDPKHNRGRHRLHNHFLIKSVALTRPGGVVALITSRHTLDAESAAARDELFEMADLLGAVRLPNKAFARSAGTDVVTDIVVLRRRMDGEEPLDRSWLTSTKRAVGEHQLPVNDYFAAHPEHVLGTLASRMGAHGPEVAVDGDPDVGATLRTALRQVADSAVLARRWYAPHPDGPYRPRLRLKPAADLQDFTGRLSADVEGKLWQTSGDGELVAVELPAEQHAQLAALIELKDLVRGLNELDRSGSDLALADAHRRLTKETYERYVAAHGPLSRPRQQQNVTTQTDDGKSVTGLTAWGYFLNDPQAYEVLALEMWEADTESVHVSEILDHAPAARRSVLGQHTDDPQQALDAVVAERGHVDLPHIAWMLQVDEDEARRRLARSVFTDPLTGDLLYSADYLSGDVRTKLEIARQAARRDAAFKVNVAELERVQPREMLPGQFAIRLGAAWLPDDLVQQFFREYLGDAHLTIQHSGNGNWHILKGRGLSEEDEVKHSAGGLHPLALLNRVLNGGSMTGRPHDDEEAARAVRVKAEEWRDAFEAWVLDNSVRAARAADVYNRQMNNRVVRDFTGTRPSLTGLDPDFTPYDHQLAAAARMAHERCLVLSHVVGAGKTAALAIGMMAMKNTGQIDKPMVAVPNYLVEQWEGEVRRLFPAARILTLTSADLADGKRDRMLQYVRANSFDLIIMSHSLFDSIPLSPEFYEFYNDEELRKLDAQILHERRREGKSISLKQLQERRQQHEENLKAKAAAVRTPGQVYLDDLGLDFFAIDEAHEYKNLAVRSKIPGARVSGSAKAQHLHAVLEWARRNKPTGPMGCLATGTPLSNAIGELHSLLLLANPDLLRALGIEEFDAFATMYGKMVERLEMTVDGKGFKSVERFASFHSVNSLLRQLWLPIVDYKDEEDLGLPLPSIKGGEPELMLVPATAHQQQLMQELGERYEAYHLGEVDKSEDNPLSINTDARVIALDPRLIDAEAEPGNKLRLLADRVAAEYHATKNNRYTYSTEDLRPHPVPGGLQMVFLNQGTPGGKNRGNFNAYQEFKDLLMARDVPADKIDFIHDAARADQRRKLVARANHGGSNVLIGSTQRMGKGLNAQNRCTHVYHVDPDFRPADMKQKDGRGRRKGNQNKVVGIVWVATENTFDSRMYGILATKAKGFDQLYKARLDAGSDEIQEVDEAIVPFEEAMAIISGNPYLIAQEELRKQLRTLTLDQNNRATQRAIVFKKVQQLNKDIDALTRDIARRGAVLPSLRPVLGDDFRITLGGVAYTKHKDAAVPLTDALAGVLQALPEKRAFNPDTTLGQLGGRDLVAVAFREDNQDVPFVRVHLDGLPGSLQRFDAVELSILKGETLLRRLTKTITEAPERQTEDEGNLTTKRATRDELLVYSEQLRGQVPGLSRVRERLSLVDALVAAQIAVNKAGEPSKDEPAAETEKRKQAVARRDELQRQLDRFDATPPAEASPEAGEALLDLEELRPRDPALLSPQQKESEAAILRAHIAVHGDPDGTAADRLAELEMPVVAESLNEWMDGFGSPAANEHVDGQRPAPEPPGENAEQTAERPADQTDAPGETAPTEPEPAPASPIAEDVDDAETDAPAPDGDGYGTADLYETFGLAQPERSPAPEPEPEAEAEAEESAGVSDGQMTVEEAQPEAVFAEPDTAVAHTADLNAAALLRHYEPLLEVVGLSGADAVSYLSNEAPLDRASQYTSETPYDRLMDDIARRADRVGGISQRGREVTIRDVSEARNALHRHLMDLALSVPDVRQGREPYGIDLASILADPRSRFTLPDAPQWRLAAAVPTGKVVVAHDPEAGYAVFNTYRRRKAGEVLREQRFWWDRDAVPEGVWRPRTDQPEEEQHQAARDLLAAFTEAGVDHAVYGQVFDRSEGTAQETAKPSTHDEKSTEETTAAPSPTKDSAARAVVEPDAETGGAASEDAAPGDDGQEGLTSADGRLAYTLWFWPPTEQVSAEVAAEWQRTRDKLAAQVDAHNEQMGQSPQEQADQLARWRRTYKGANRLEPFRPMPSLRLTKRADAPGLTPAEYGIGSWVTWRDVQSGQQVTGQVMAPGAAGDTWYVSTDRTGHTGEYHVLSRSGKKATGYTYSVNGATADLRPADGPGEQLPLEDLPEVDSIPARPVTSYADYVPEDGLAMVREPIAVTVGEIEPRFDPAEVAFDVTADGIPFVVKLDQDDETLISTFVPRIEADGEMLALLAPMESKAEAIDACVRMARAARENVDKPLYAHNRNNELALAADGVCGQCSLHEGDNETRKLYRVNGGDPQCLDHVASSVGKDRDDLVMLALARRIWAIRVTPEFAVADEAAPPADTEQPAEVPAAEPAEQETAAALASQGPHDAAAAADETSVRPSDEEQPAPEGQPTDRTQEGGSVASQSAKTEQLGLFSGPAPDASDGQTQPDTARAAAAGNGETAPDDLVRAQLAKTEVTGAAGIRYSLHGSWTPGEPDTVEFHIVRVTRGVGGTVDFSGTRDECLAYIESEAAVRSAAEAVDENSEQQAAALVWLRDAGLEAPAASGPVADGSEAPSAFPAELTAAAAAAELPELDVVLLDVDLATLAPAEPYDTDEEAQADIDRLNAAFARWDALPTVQRYYEADQQQRSDGEGDPTNPVAQLAAAYRDAEQSLRDSPAGSLDDLLRHIHTVAVWSGALEPVVDEDLRGPLGQVREAAALLASRSRATVDAFEAELAALAANSAEQSAAVPESAASETEPAEQGPADVDDEPETRTDPGPAEPAAEGLTELPAAAQTTTDTQTDDVPAPDPQEAQESPAAVDDAPGDSAADTAVDDDPAPDRVPVPQDAPEPAGTVPDEGMLEARREASFLEQDRPQTTDDEQQTPEPGTAAAPTAPAGEDAPNDETARDASEEPTMTTPPIPETTDAPGEPINEEPPAPQRYYETVPLAGDSSYRLRLSGLDGQPVDSGEVLRGDLVIATIHPGGGGDWFARLAAEPADSTYLADQPQEAAAHAAVMHSAFTGAPYGPPADAAVGDEPRQRVDVLRATLRDVAAQHREAVALAAARAYPDFEQNEHFRELVGALDGLAAAVSEDYGSQQMTQHLDAVQVAVNAWGGALPADPGHPERGQLAFPLASLLYDSRRLQDQVQATLAAVQAERAAIRDQPAPAEREPEVQPTTAAPADTGAPEEPTEFRSPEVPKSRTTETARGEAPAAPAAPTDAPSPESPDGAATPEGDGPALDAAVDGIRRALEDALRADQPEAAAQPGELPLWTGTENSTTDTAAMEPPAGPLDVRAEFQAVLDAWDEHVPPENGTAQDLVAELDADLATLQHSFAEAVAPAAPAAPPTTTDQDSAAPDESAEAAATTSVAQQAGDVNAALQQADTHAPALQDLPEWQKIQTVRGAFGHLARVIKERAGETFDRLMGDQRVGEFFRKISIATCEKVAGWAQAGADRLRRRGEGKDSDAPATDALRDVADAATAYGSPGGGRSGPPPASRDAASTTVDIPAMRQLGEALSRPLPGAKDGSGARVSTAAARGKSTTRRGTKKPSGSVKKSGGATEQAGHLRRGGTEPQQQNHKPTQR